MADKVLICKDCKAEFVFTEGEQTFFKEKGFDNEPQRCPECRRANKQQKSNGNGGFNRGNRSNSGTSNNRGGQGRFNNNR